MKQGSAVGDGRFVIDSLAGRGGMAEVFRAKDLATGRDVAVKIFRERSAEDVRASRFRREVDVLETIRHPGVVEHVAHGVEPDGALYLAMEWLDGEELSARLAREPLSIADSIALARRIADALGAAHELGVVHRDVKPANIFLVGGTITKAKLLDFGIAAIGGGAAITRVNEAIGTPAYMAPEQAKGHRVTPAADVFALGCVLFECLTGRAPYWGENPLAVMTKIVIEDAPLVTSIRPDVPEAVSSLLVRMFAKDPDERVADGEKLAAELFALEGARPAAPAPKPPPERVVLGAAERQLLSVILVRHVDLGVAAAEEVMKEVVLRGGAAERLVDGTLIVTVRDQGAGAGQATAAARCALVVRRMLPRHPMVLVTGRTDGAKGVPTGEVVDRGVLLLTSEEQRPTTPDAAPAVRIDEATAGLLDRHFAVAGDASGFYLLGELDPREAARTLLGEPSPFVGRAAELHQLVGAYERMVETRAAQAVVVVSPPGAGKSRLYQELLAHVEASDAPPVTLVGRADATLRSAALGLVATAFTDLFGLREGESDEVARSRIRTRVARNVPAADQDRLAPLLGEIVGVRFSESPAGYGQTSERSVLFDHVRAACHDFVGAELGERPIVWILDDIQESDDASIAFFASALRAFATRPLFLVALGRPEVAERLADAWRESPTTWIDLPPLATDAAAKLVRHALGTGARDALVETIVARAQGNAFFLEELVRTVAGGQTDQLPVTLLAVVEATLELLSPMCRRILRCASVFGPRFTTAGLRAVSPEGSDREVETSIDELVAKEILGRAGGPARSSRAKLSFRSEIVRAACYESLTDQDRTQAHRLAGEWLESIGGPQDASEVARQYSLAKDRRRSASWYVRACEIALEQGAFSEAVASAERAIAAGAGGLMLARIRLLQTEAHRHLGENAKMVATAREAMTLSRPRTPPWWTALADAMTGAVELGRMDLASELAQAITSGPIPPIFDVARAAIKLFHIGRYDEANRMLDAITKEREDDTAASAAEQQGWVFRALACRALYAGDLATFAQRSERAVELFDRSGDIREAAAELVSLGFVRHELGLYLEAEEALRLSLATAERLQLPAAAATARARLGSVLMRLGRSEEAERALMMAASTFAREQNLRMEGLVRRQLGLLSIDRGQLDHAFEQIMHAAQLLSGYPPLLPMALAACARVFLATERSDEALLMATDAMAALDRARTVDEGESFTRLAHAEALRAAGKTEEAEIAIRTARDRLVARASQLDAKWRPTFLEEVRENRRTVELALEWLKKMPAAAPPPASAPRTQEPPPASGPGKKAAPREPEESPCRAIVLTADPDRRAMLERILTDGEAEVTAASSPGEMFYLLESIDESDRVVLFLDPIVSGIEGPALVELLRGRIVTERVLVVVAGGLSVPMMRDAAKAWGADGFVALTDGPVAPDVALKRWLDQV